MSPEIVLAETYLSRKPSENALTIALLSCALLFAFTGAAWKYENIYDLFIASPSAVFQDHQYWRAVTSIIIHHDVPHLLSNALFFSFLTYLVYGYFGFITYPVMMFALGTVTNFISLATYPPEVRMLGASGLVYNMAAFWLMLYILIERRHSWKTRFLRAFGFAAIVLVDSSFDPAVSYRTHWIGAGVGLIAGAVFFIFKKSEFRKHEIYMQDEPELV